MKFTKMHGCGNDYVYVDATRDEIPNADQLSIQISDRHFGIGSDGLILIAPSEIADFQMIMYNADGSRGEMCGNGIRCVGKFVYDKGLTRHTNLTVETLAGIKNLELVVGEDGTVSQVKVDMGKPIFDVSQIPVTYQEKEMISGQMEVDGKQYTGTAVSMGNPHFVIFQEEDVYELNLEEIGPKFEKHQIFPNRVNTEFVNVIDRKHLRMRVWERGSGETWACGTGACGVAMAAIRNDLVDHQVEVELRGGKLLIEYDEAEDCVYMTGPATTVFEGEMEM